MQLRYLKCNGTGGVKSPPKVRLMAFTNLLLEVR